MTNSISEDLSLAFQRLGEWVDAGFEPGLQDDDPKLTCSLIQVAGLVIVVLGASVVFKSLLGNRIDTLILGGAMTALGHDTMQVGRNWYHISDVNVGNSINSVCSKATGLASSIRALFRLKNPTQSYQESVQKDTQRRLIKNTWLLKHLMR